MILGVTGKVFDDSKVKISRQLTVLINKDIFDKAEDKYKNGQTYHLAFNDCTTFVAADSSLDSSNVRKTDGRDE